VAPAEVLAAALGGEQGEALAEGQVGGHCLEEEEDLLHHFSWGAHDPDRFRRVHEAQFYR